ncbi:DUF2239 family protein [Saccharospirillum sp. MSK14-1]|uniref:DUF2239 family protein n=1 Tax=Saccharospirillum sp. MSK14-1 TaxID=1897632 RepID=UPI001304E8FE|nr:DUF2239 family protein [Saccharospirillum sp. MSK14-1]
MELIIFHGNDRVALGEPAEALSSARRYLAEQPCVGGDLLVLDRHTARLVEIDFSQDDGVILNMLSVLYGATEPGVKRARGRPKLGVQSREVSLLPRHWQWLNAQPGGASAALRRLVEDARRSPEAQLEEARLAVDRFLQTLAGDLPHYEEVLRQFYRRQYEPMREMMSGWPAAVIEHTSALVDAVQQAEQAQ